ncbi:MAG: flagellar hook-associated protein FlgK [Pseudomonadota bacterium]
MSISSALSNALTGLRAAGRGAEVVSGNLANALTPGYGRRILDLSPASAGNSGGVRIDGITRVMDASLVTDKRLAEAAQKNASASADFFSRLEGLLGTPDEAEALSARLSAFESALIAASSRPDATERLTGAIFDAARLANGFKEVSKGIEQARTAADRDINAQVNDLNLALQQVADLNVQIVANRVQGGDPSALLDLRQQAVDRISAIVPVREVARSNGQIGLYSIGGAVLLDGTPAKLAFTPANLVTPYMSLSANTLSGLTINGQAVPTDPERGALRGGSLSANFEIRDELGPAAQEQLDALARDLIERFQDPAVDPTLSLGDAGLFTDNGLAFSAVNELGLSERLTINPAVDPDQGGAAWRLRDGIGSAAQGNVGDATLLQSLTAALDAPRTPASGNFGTGASSSINLVAGYVSQIGSDRTNTEQELSYTSARLTELTERLLADGVDSDSELQRMLTIEQNYAANARMIQTVEEMMDQLLRI